MLPLRALPQEVAEDYQLIFAERGAHTFVSTHNGHPYVAPFSGNIVELCPVGALTSKPYRFRARPWDIEGAGGICTLCPSQCNVEFTVRDEKVMRVLARDHAEVDDGWLCDKGRFAYQSIHVDERLQVPLVRDGGALREVSWDRALQTAAGIARHRGRDRNARRRSGHQRGGLPARPPHARRPRLPGHRLPQRASRSRSSSRARSPSRRCRRRSLTSSSRTPCSSSDASRSTTRRSSTCESARAYAAAACVWPSPPPGPARSTPTPASSPGWRPGEEVDVPGRARPGARRVGSDEDAPHAGWPKYLTAAGPDIVIVWGERIGPEAVPHLLSIANRLEVWGRQGAGLLEIPSTTNGRGLREAGVIPDAGPGYKPLDTPGRDAAGIAHAAADGELTALYLFQTDPLRDQPDRAVWERALDRASLVVAHASVLTDGLSEHADVIFPADSYAEKEGTVVHPDGRIQRLRTAIRRPGEVRAGWWVIEELAKRAGFDNRVLTGSLAFQQLAAAVPFYRGLTLEEVGGRGVRWPPRPEASELAARGAAQRARRPPGPGGHRCGGGPPGEHQWRAPAGTLPADLGRARGGDLAGLKFTIAQQQVELSPEDATRLGIGHGDDVEVAQNGTTLHARAAVRSGIRPGVAFLADGIAEDSANELTEPLVEVRKR